MFRLSYLSLPYDFLYCAYLARIVLPCAIVTLKAVTLADNCQPLKYAVISAVILPKFVSICFGVGIYCRCKHFVCLAYLTFGEPELHPPKRLVIELTALELTKIDLIAECLLYHTTQGLVISCLHSCVLLSVKFNSI